jgi:cytochrome P450
MFFKSTPKGGDTINGRSIPEGTAIGMNTPSMMRSIEMFGTDADLFRPERFMEADAALRTKMERTVDLLFGYGRWMCAGKPLAMMELNKVYFEVSEQAPGPVIVVF